MDQNDVILAATHTRVTCQRLWNITPNISSRGQQPPWKQEIALVGMDAGTNATNDGIFNQIWSRTAELDPYSRFTHTYPHYNFHIHPDSITTLTFQPN